MASFESIQRIISGNNLESQTEVQELLQKAAKLEHAETAVADRALEAIQSKVSQIAADKVDNPFPEPEHNIDWWTEQFLLGTTNQGNDIYLSAEELAQHTAVLAQSGWGKTTLFRRLMKQVSQTDINFTAFDLNNDYRHLANQDDVDVIVLPIDKLRFNPLKPPPGVEFDRWKNTFAEIFADSQALLNASENFTDAELDELYQAYVDIPKQALEQLGQDNSKIGGGKQGDYPTLIDLDHAIDDKGFHPSDPNKSYQSRVLNRVRGIIGSAYYTVDCVHGHDLETLLTEHNLIIELDGLRTTAQNFFMELIYAWILEYRNAQNHHDNELRHITFWDECKTIFSKYKEMSSDAGLPEIDDRFDKSRNFGEASIGADQEPLKLTDSFLSNTYIKILGTSLDSKQFNRAAKSMGLDEDRHQRRGARRIDTPYALVKIGTRGPFKVKLPLFPVEKDVTDEMLKDLYLDTWNRLLHPDTPSIFGSSEKPEQPELLAEMPETVSKSPEKLDIELSAGAKQLIDDIVANPVTFVTERYEQFSSRYKGNKSKNELVETNICKEILISKRDGRGKLLGFTELGKKYLIQEGIDASFAGRGGIEHKYWQHRIKALLETEGYESEIEVKNRDVYGDSDTGDIAVEVAMGKNEREIDHIKDALEYGYDRIVVACRTPQVKGYIKRKAGEAGLPTDEIKFCTFKDIDFTSDSGC